MGEGSGAPARPIDQQAKITKQQVADFVRHFNGDGSQTRIRPRPTYRRKVLENQV
jgi:hypothetical protein